MAPGLHRLAQGHQRHADIEERNRFAAWVTKLAVNGYYLLAQLERQHQVALQVCNEREGVEEHRFNVAQLKGSRSGETILRQRLARCYVAEQGSGARKVLLRP